MVKKSLNKYVTYLALISVSFIIPETRIVTVTIRDDVTKKIKIDNG